MSERQIDRHKTPRSFESGAQKRKKAAEKEKEREGLLKKNRKLSSYFKKLDKAPEETIQDQPEAQAQEGVQDSQHMSGDIIVLTQDEQAKDKQVDLVLPKKRLEGETSGLADSVEEVNLMVGGGEETNLLVYEGEEGERDHPDIGEEAPHPANESQNDSSEPVSFRECNDVGLWPQVCTSEFIDFWAAEGSKRLQNCTSRLLHSSVPQKCKRGRQSIERRCSKYLFVRNNRNGESVNRFWLCFSPSTGKVYCYVCKLITPQRDNLSGEGFCDWKHAYVRMAEHEVSKSHLNSVTILAQRESRKGSLNAQLLQKSEQIRGYWRHVLLRVVSTIKFLAERGLAFRGEDELQNSPRNGNFLGIMELIAEFDPFLSSHIKERGQKGRGRTNYLSSTIVEKIIKLMGQRAQQTIVDRIKKSKYYSVSVDSTPDESNIDQLTVIIRYMEGSTPKERYLTFLPNCGHTGSALAEALLQFLQKHKIEIGDCRGQAYDNAANMSGKYRGMQAFIKQKCKVAELVPCCGHSLNLAGKAAANACPKAVHFFNFVQQLYVFFTASTHRYQVLVTHLKQGKTNYLVPKSLSDTRWACRANATKALVHSYTEIKEALRQITLDNEEKCVVRSEATGLVNQMATLETCILSFFWNDILSRFDATSRALQHPQLVLKSAIDMLKSLKDFVESKRDQFSEYEEKGRNVSDTQGYCEETSRNRMSNVRLNPLDYLKGPETILSKSDKFKVTVFLPVIDQITSSLSHRISSYEVVSERFGILNCLAEATPLQISTAALNLVSIYEDDLDPSLENELQQFAYLVKNSKVDENEDAPIELSMYKMLLKEPYKSTFPNVEIVLRMYLVLMVTNCSGERSFSKMKLIKNRLRSTMGQERLSYLTLLSIEHDILRELDFSDIIEDFASKKSRKVNL